MDSTQQHLIIEDIDNSLVSLKDGSVSLILETTAVNFGLLSEEEQVSIIYSFAGLLNSLSFPIQIVIRSKILDVSSYLQLLNLALNKQANPLLIRMTQAYVNFVQSIIKINQVLDKQFYVCLNVTNVEIGLLTKGSQNKFKKALISLTPRRDHIVRQLQRIGLRSKQLTTEEIIRLFYNILNDAITQTQSANIPVTPRLAQPPDTHPEPSLAEGGRVERSIAVAQPIHDRPLTPAPQSVSLTPPFVVEELTDDYGP